VVAVCDGSPGRLAVLAAGVWTVRGSRPDGPQPGGRSGAFTARSPDGPSSGPDGPRWHRVVFFSSYDLDLVPLGRDLRVLRVSRSPGASPDDIVSAFRDRGSLSRRVNVAACPSPDGSSAWASAKGGSEVAGDGRERGGNPAAFVFVPRPGRVRLQ
jgi:hypothetical protein